MKNFCVLSDGLLRCVLRSQGPVLRLMWLTEWPSGVEGDMHPGMFGVPPRWAVRPGAYTRGGLSSSEVFWKQSFTRHDSDVECTRKLFGSFERSYVLLRIIYTFLNDASWMRVPSEDTYPWGSISGIRIFFIFPTHPLPWFLFFRLDFVQGPRLGVQSLGRYASTREAEA